MITRSRRCYKGNYDTNDEQAVIKMANEKTGETVASVTEMKKLLLED